MRLFRSKSTQSLRELVEACQRRDARAQMTFYERYKGKLMGICLRYARTVAEAEDIFQEGIVRVFDKINEIKNPDALDAWVKTVMIRYAIDYYHQHTTKENLLEPYRIEAEEWNGAYSDLDLKLDVEVMLKAINDLPDGYRLVVNLHFVDGYSHAEIAGLLGIAEVTSRSQLMRGRNLLLKRLEQKGLKKNEIL